MKSIADVKRAGAVIAVLLLGAPAWAGAPWTVDWWTVDGGGEVFTSGGSWELSGSIGQWDATAGAAATGGSWELTGGFWAVSSGPTDSLFKDGFEG